MIKKQKMKKKKECSEKPRLTEYGTFQVAIDNLPYGIMTLLGAVIFIACFGPSFWGWLSAVMFLLYGLVGVLWIMVFVCPYCHFFNTRKCPCGYGRISAKIRKQRNGSRFVEKFKKHIPMLFPLWAAPVAAGIVFLIIQFSPLLLIFVVAFCLVGFVILPLTSAIYGCAHCQQRDECPWMKLKKTQAHE